MAQKRGPDEEKSDFEFLAFLVLYYINKACVNETYWVKMKMYHSQNFVFVCQLLAISKDQIHLSIYIGARSIRELLISC
jgi:hypothetical protein